MPARAGSPLSGSGIPVFRPSISEEEIDAVCRVLRGGWLGPGPRVADFEQEFARRSRTPFAISTSSGTEALNTLLRALGIGPGDEVIVPSLTYVSVLQVLRGAGAVPAFADVEERFLTLDPVDAARRIGPRTRGIVTVHHGGQLSDVDALDALARDAAVFLVDDAAHAAGATLGGRPVGDLCRATCFSFSAVKNMTTGDGGMITTRDPELAARMASYRSLGIDRSTWTRYGLGRAQRWRYDVRGPGQRCHMNDIAAALGLVQLRRLDDLNARRRRLAERYDRALAPAGIRAIAPRPGSMPSWHMYTILVEERDDFVEAMAARGIAVGVHYFPLHLYPECASPRVELPVTEAVWRSMATLPLFPDLGEDDQDRVIRAVIELRGGPRVTATLDLDRAGATDIGLK